uniref:Uncharacterized protein n=1 Tax=Rhizophora mucronata TaxID=61149 RepID=A0A2P2MD57_RHIMU
MIDSFFSFHVFLLFNLYIIV